MSQPTFLCSNHMRFLKQSPYKALEVYKKTLHEGQLCFQTGEMVRARDCFGAALEAAEIILEAGILDPISAVNHLMTSTILLSTSLNKLEDNELSQFYLVLARYRLDTIIQTFHPTAQLRDHLMECINALDMTYKTLFKSWSHAEQFETLNASYQHQGKSASDAKVNDVMPTLH